MSTTDRSGRPAPSAWVFLTLGMAAPGVTVVGLNLALLVAGALGMDVLWRVEDLTVPEAVVVRDTAEVARLIEAGADPNAPGVVRAGYLSPEATTITPLEAAVATNQEDAFLVLRHHGARIDSNNWGELLCLAEIRNANDVRPLIESLRSTYEPVNCEGAVPAWWK